jgi:hypothetical protein
MQETHKQSMMTLDLLLGRVGAQSHNAVMAGTGSEKKLFDGERRRLAQLIGGAVESGGGAQQPLGLAGTLHPLP